MSEVKTRNFCFLLYPDNPVHTAALDRIESWDNSQRPLSYLSCMHHYYDLDGNHVDDGDGKPHYHVVTSFSNPCHISPFAVSLGLVDDIGQADLQFIRPCKRLDSALLYLTHTGYEDKEQYSRDCLRGTSDMLARYDRAYSLYIQKNGFTVTDAFQIFREWVRKQERHISTDMLIDFLIQSGLIRYRNERLLRDLVDEHNLKLRALQNRDYMAQIANGYEILNGENINEVLL